MLKETAIDKTLEFVDKYVPEWFDKGVNEPLFIYVSGPQGSGKTYTSNLLYQHLMAQYGQTKNIALMSIDDFYLTHKEQLNLNHQYKDNFLLQGRGLPGTHDMTLLNQILQSIVQRTTDIENNGNEQEREFIHIPRYDKSKFNGEGDRSDEVIKCKVPIDICILEGWFLGFAPILSTEDDEPLLTGDMIDINAKLFMYSDLMWNNPEINSLGIVFATDHVSNVYEWRKQQEHGLIEATGTGMNDMEVEKFVDRYMPCYKLYYDDFIHSEKLGSVATLTLGIDIKRHLYYTKTRCIE